MTAAPITSAGRFSPRGPRGIAFIPWRQTRHHDSSRSRIKYQIRAAQWACIHQRIQMIDDLIVARLQLDPLKLPQVKLFAVFFTDNREAILALDHIELADADALILDHRNYCAVGVAFAKMTTDGEGANRIAYLLACLRQ
jgi:hypothetical protein